MKFPIINKRPIRNVTVPKLSGGTNLRDAVTMINDNQLTDSKNIWYKDGILKTRPALSEFGKRHKGIPVKNAQVIANPTDITTEYNGEIYRLFYYSVSGEQNGVGHAILVSFIGLLWVGETDIKELPKFENEGKISFVTKYKEKLYVFTSQKNVYTMEIDLNENSPEWVKIVDDPEETEANRFYIPTVVTNCSGGKFGATISSLQESGGVMVEGYNLLSGYYKIIYSTVNREILDASNEDDAHPMQYSLLHSISGMTGKILVAKITDADGNVITHTITLNDETQQFETSTPKPYDDGKRIMVFGKRFALVDRDNNGAIFVKASDYVENNLEIIAPCPNSADNLDKVFGMTQCTWFGGDAAGISGGTRLFTGGNINKKEKSLILWSGLNNPLYFSENCYSYVGDSTQAVTAFGRQNDSLIIFKEREIFYTQYTRNSDITAESLINQSVVDYTASNVYFPIIQLHSAIGCDSPKSIQLCRNFLVWLCDGKIYTLRNQNQYSERNIYCVSDMIEIRLGEFMKSKLKNATSADFEGHYFLFAGSKVFVMNYESYGYINVSSYNKTDDAQVMIPWWYWELPFEIGVLGDDYADDLEAYGGFTLGDKLCVAMYNAVPWVMGGFDFYNLDYARDDFGYKINSSFTTKIFDFNLPHFNKNVPLVNIAFGNNGGEPIKVSFVTDSGTEESERVIISESNGDEYSPNYVHNRQFRPCKRLINRIGVKIECEGNMSVDSISLDYRVLGGTR